MPTSPLKRPESAADNAPPSSSGSRSPSGSSREPNCALLDVMSRGEPLDERLCFVYLHDARRMRQKGPGRAQPALHETVAHPYRQLPGSSPTESPARGRCRSDRKGTPESPGEASRRPPRSGRLRARQLASPSVSPERPSERAASKIARPNRSLPASSMASPPVIAPTLIRRRSRTE